MYRLVLFASVFAASVTATPAVACDVTEVDAYEGDLTYCSDVGVFKKPSLLSAFNAATLKECAGSCLETDECLTFGWNKTVKPSCQLFEAYVEDMQLVRFPRKPLDTYYTYDKQCFSRDCQTIKACVDTKDQFDSCLTGYYRESRQGSFYDEFFYYRYACGYGLTARPRNFPSRVSRFPGDYEICRALGECNSDLYYERGPKDPKWGPYRTGSLDLQHHIPTNEWICVQYNDERPITYGKPYDETFEEIKGHTSRNRFTLKNSSIGTSVGFYLRYYGFEYSSSS